MKSIRKIFKYITIPKGKVFVYFIFLVLSAFFSLFSIALLAPFLNLIFGQQSLQIKLGAFDYILNKLINLVPNGLNNKLGLLTMICITMVVATIFKNIFSYAAAYVSADFRTNILMQLRSRMYNKILNLPLGYFSNQRKGDLLNRMSSDTNEVFNSIVSTLDSLIKDPITIISSIIAMVILSPQLSLSLLVLLPIAGLIIGRVGKTLKKDSITLSKQQGENFSLIDETIGGIKIVKAFFSEKFFSKKFEEQSIQLKKNLLKITNRRDLAGPMTETLGIICVCAVLYIGGRLVLNNNGFISGGSFITYIITFATIINPAKALSNSNFTIRRGLAAIERIDEVIEVENPMEDHENQIEKNGFHKEIKFENISFSHQNENFLQNINFTIPKGKTVALVGSSGAGKSTLADLLPRFFDVQDGCITIDGIDIKNIKTESLRKLISIVTQEPILFNDTIAQNIALGKPTATQEEIESAAKIANAHNFIIQKPNGYNENIGDRGSKLSGGEKQRITIARAVLLNPEILILDEATSSLDTESEAMVKEALEKLMNNRTTLIVAHRLSTIKNADEILVMQKGKIIERGTHESLIAQNGFYNKLVQMQDVEA